MEDPELTPIQSWWNWCSESFGQMFIGVTAPLLLIFAVGVLVFTGGGDGGSSLTPQPPRSDVAGACVGSTPGVTGGVCATGTVSTAPDSLVVRTATPVPPTATPAPRSYTVQAGDTLSVICASEVSDLDLDACIDAIVDLSGLGGPDEITEGQSLRLPAASKATPAAGTPTTSTRSTTSATPVSPAEAPSSTSDVVFEPESSDEETTEAEATEVPAEETESGPTASLVALDEPEDDDEPVAEPTLTPTPEIIPEIPSWYSRENATLYTVQPGDTLITICIEQAPDLSVSDCVHLTMDLNDMDDPEVYAYEGILIP